MNCADWEQRIALHAGGDAAPEEAVRVERHLSECPGCQRFWVEMRDSLSEWREFHGALPETAHFTALRTRVLAEIESSRRPRWRFAWVPALAAATMAIAVAVWPGRQPAIPDPPRMMASIPEAPLVIPVKAARLPRPEKIRRAASPRVAHEPVTIQLQTPDPNIVIYWITE